MTRLLFTLLGCLSLVALPAWAKPETYLLDKNASSVLFTITMGQSPLKGQMPVSDARIVLDFDKAAASSASVTLDAASARMGLPFATTAMKSDKVLDTTRFPSITFVGTRFQASGQKAQVDGTLTLRGVTRPLTLSAQIFRPQGSSSGERDHLVIRMKGSLPRSAFGATGYADLVGDTVLLDITANIRRQGAP